MRLLAVVQERDPGARMADTTGQTPFLPMARYIDAVAPVRATRNEITAAGFALQHGGTHLLVPTIIEWRQMRTDDPLGALMPHHNGVVIELRLVRLDPVAVEGNVRFKNQSRFTVNQSADRLLNEDFRRTVLRLLPGTAPPHARKRAGDSQSLRSLTGVRFCDPFSISSIGNTRQGDAGGANSRQQVRPLPTPEQSTPWRQAATRPSHGD